MEHLGLGLGFKIQCRIGGVENLPNWLGWLRGVDLEVPCSEKLQLSRWWFCFGGGAKPLILEN